MSRPFRLFSSMWILVPALCGLLSLSLPAMAQGAEPPSDPILRIDPEMHTAPVRSIAVDSQGRYLVTGSEDKTVRVWDAVTGEHLRTLRPPIGPGSEGKIYAVAVSPDGSTVACGGRTGKDWDDSYTIYFFDRETGLLKGRIKGESSLILDLDYSPDGRYLAVALHEGKGMVVYDMETRKRAAVDTDYAAPCFSVDFDEAGRLVTASVSGTIRIYDETFKLAAERKARGGKAPLSASFSPDGSLVAVGFADSTAVDILSGETLKRVRRADTRGVSNGNLASVAWSGDGSTLYAAGQWGNKEGANLVRMWKNEGKGSHKDLAASLQDTIQQVVGFPGGGVAFASGDPSFGVFDAQGEKVLFKTSPVIDFREGEDELLVSPDGKVVQFRCSMGGETFKARFSIADRFLTEDPATDGSLEAPRTRARGLRVKDWDRGGSPSLDGKKLELDKRERSWSLAIAPDEESFVLGTDWSLRRFDRSGGELWRVQAPGTTRAVNVTGDGRTVAAAHGDGTIRWYRLEDGKELLALFPHGDRKRWVLWTPSGYYDTSVGAENIVGWHKNNGADAAADFFPVSRFRSVFYRPDVTAVALRALDEDKALQVAQKETGRTTVRVDVGRMLPPVVTVVDPPNEFQTDKAELTVGYEVRSSTEEPVTGVKVLVDGRPVQFERSPFEARDGVRKEITVPIPPKDCAVSLLVENRYAVSEPATVKIRWLAEEAPASAESGGMSLDSLEDAFKPKLYVLAVGVSEYEREDLRLRFAAKDAEAFAQVFERQEGGLYREVEVRMLVDDKATKYDILDGLDWLRSQTTQRDIAFIFIAGHGMNDERSGTYYYMPVDVDPDRLIRSGVPSTDITATVRSLPGKIVLFMDTCHSGNVFGADVQTRGLAAGPANDVMGFVNELTSAENGAVVFMSSSGSQKSLESEEWGHGAFTKALLEALTGQSPLLGGREKITIAALDFHISERVKELTNNRQTPNTNKPNTIGDFPVALASRSGT